MMQFRKRVKKKLDVTVSGQHREISSMAGLHSHVSDIGSTWRTLKTSIEPGMWEGDRLPNTGDIYRTGRVGGG